MYRKSLSIIIPLNNSKKYIDTLLDVFLDCSTEDRQKFEVILVDDGSKDDTFKYLTKFYKKYEIFNILKLKEPKGEGGVFNAALKEAKGKYVKVLHPEDLFDKDAFVKMLSFVEANEYDLILHGYELNDKVQHVSKAPEQEGFARLGRGELVNGLPSNTYLSFKNMIYKKEVFTKNEFKAVEDFFFSDIYTSIWFARHSYTFYSLQDLDVYKYSVSNETQKIALENYVKYQGDFWKVLSIVLTEIDPLNDKTKELVAASIFRYALFDLALVWGKNKEPWKKHFNRIMNLVEKNVYLYDEYKGSILSRKTMNGKKIGFGNYATKVLKHLDKIRMI